MSSPISKNTKSSEESGDVDCDSSSAPDSPSSDHSSSPATPTNYSQSDNVSKYNSLVPKLEIDNNPSPLTVNSDKPNLQVYTSNLTPQDVSSYGQRQLPPPPMILPPYKPTQTPPEGISLSNYVKLMTLQQQQQQGGGAGGGPPIYPMTGTFPPAGLLPDIPSSELTTVLTPTTLAPPYQDMSYAAQCLLMSQAQQLGSFQTGFQHTLTKASQMPSHSVKQADDKHAHMVYQQDIGSGQMLNSSSFRGSINRRAVKRPHDHSMEPESERGAESGLEQLADCGVSQFPGEEGSREDRKPMFSESSERLPHQLKWRAHMVESWQGMCDAALIDIHNIGFHVETDKGFNFSIIDDSFVCQKKNHFQVSVTILFNRVPKFVKLKNGTILPIEKFSLNLHGIRFEQVNSRILLEQSRSDRSKNRYVPDMIDIPESPEKAIKRTVCRLHFSETTQNNMRKRGKPNPDQKHFSLVVALHAETPEGSLPVVAHVSERIVVRASNPGNFDSDTDYLWYRCSNSENIFHHGRVGINTDKPDEALTVHGNIQLTGQLLQISDSRVKRNIQPVVSECHLEKLSQLQLYKYQLATLTDSPATPHKRTQVGLLAQEVQQVFPYAVTETNAEAVLEDGGHVTNVLMVDKDQLLMETIGAVQELTTLTNELSEQLNDIRKEQSSWRQTNKLWLATTILLTLIVSFLFIYH